MRMLHALRERKERGITHNECDHGPHPKQSRREGAHLTHVVVSWLSSGSPSCEHRISHTAILVPEGSLVVSGAMPVALVLRWLRVRLRCTARSTAHPSNAKSAARVWIP